MTNTKLREFKNFHEANQRLDGLSFTPCEEDCSWVHGHFASDKAHQIVIDGEGSPYAGTLAVEACSAAAMLDDTGIFRATDLHVLRDAATVLELECRACHFQFRERLCDLLRRQPRRTDGEPYGLADVASGNYLPAQCDRCLIQIESDPEDWLLAYLVSMPHGSESLRGQEVHVFDGSGRRKKKKADAVLESNGLPTLVIEFDGDKRNHATVPAMRKDTKWTQWLLNSGYLVVRVRPHPIPGLLMEHPNLIQFRCAAKGANRAQDLRRVASFAEQLMGLGSDWREVWDPICAVD